MFLFAILVAEIVLIQKKQKVNKTENGRRLESLTKKKKRAAKVDCLEYHFVWLFDTSESWKNLSGQQKWENKSRVQQLQERGIVT